MCEENKNTRVYTSVNGGLVLQLQLRGDVGGGMNITYTFNFALFLQGIQKIKKGTNWVRGVYRTQGRGQIPDVHDYFFSGEMRRKGKYGKNGKTIRRGALGYQSFPLAWLFPPNIYIYIYIYVCVFTCTHTHIHTHTHTLSLSLSLSYTHTHTHTYIYIYIYIYIYFFFF